MSTNIAQAVATGIMLARADQYKAKSAVLAPALPAAPATKEAPTNTNKLLGGLDALNFQNQMNLKVQLLQARSPLAQPKEPQLAQAKALVAPTLLKKEERSSFHAPSSDKSKAENGLFAGLVFHPIESVNDEEEENTGA
ncbi:MAG: hypothetical protein QE263_10010 [Vampirovibrionales bacterium]|nr:hypothetical protein [Vampirovibrionales bacterium]